MKNYRKKPVVIQAQQIKGSDFDAPYPNDDHIPGVLYNPIIRQAICHTLEGDMAGKVGDFIIRGVAGELYPCREDIFYATYEEVQT